MHQLTDKNKMAQLFAEVVIHVLENTKTDEKGDNYFVDKNRNAVTKEAMNTVLINHFLIFENSETLQ